MGGPAVQGDLINLGRDGKPEPHGYTEITYDRDRIPTHHLSATAPQD